MAERAKNVGVNGSASYHVSRETVAHLGARRLAALILDEVRDNDRLREKVLQEIDATGALGHVNLSVGDAAPDEELHFVGDSPAMRQVFSSIRKFAATDLPVLITGESGTGKELVAAAIHERSSFCDGPFVPVNCGGIPESLIASEMFGYEKGAFTGASQRRLGRIEAAEGGTLFLDEIGDLPLQLQGHLLRFLQEGTIDRVGSQRSVQVNVRVIAATNRDLKAAVEQGTFRLDLYYRLNVLDIHLPPLRERAGDVDLLSRYFLQKFGREMSGIASRIDPAALEMLRRHPWPGNVRELISVLRRAAVMAASDVLRPQDLELEGPARVVAPQTTAMQADDPGDGDALPPGRPKAIPAGTAARSLSEVRRNTERQVLVDALSRNRHNVTRTARELGVSRVTLYRLMEKFELRSRSCPVTPGPASSDVRH